MGQLHMPGLQIARYRFTFSAVDQVVFNGQQGSLLRGAFGHALKGLGCMLPDQACASCPLAAGCVYPEVFEPLKQTRAGKRFTPPPPFVLHLDQRLEGQYRPGERFSFSINLFGTAVQHINLLVFAWQRAGWGGFGAGKKRAQLVQVDYQAGENDWQQIFSDGQPGVRAHQQVLLSVTAPETVRKVELEMKTPTRISLQGNYCNSKTLDASLLLRNLHRKIHLYSLTYLGRLIEMPPLDAGIHLQFDGTVHKWHRYSTRQHAAMPMDGLVGKVKMEGDLTPWYFHLWLGQYTHLGKNTSFGLGQYEIQLIE